MWNIISNLLLFTILYFIPLYTFVEMLSKNCANLIQMTLTNIMMHTMSFVLLEIKYFQMRICSLSFFSMEKGRVSWLNCFSFFKYSCTYEEYRSKIVDKSFFKRYVLTYYFEPLISNEKLQSLLNNEYETTIYCSLLLNSVHHFSADSVHAFSSLLTHFDDLVISLVVYLDETFAAMKRFHKREEYPRNNSVIFCAMKSSLIYLKRLNLLTEMLRLQISRLAFVILLRMFL